MEPFGAVSRDGVLGEPEVRLRERHRSSRHGSLGIFTVFAAVVESWCIICVSSVQQW